jgi:CBS domain-containing protein
MTVDADTNLAEAAETMLRHSIGALPVVDGEGRLVGILTEGDFMAHRVGIPFSTFHVPKVMGRWMGEDGVERIYAAARRSTVGQAMTSPVHSIPEAASITEVVRLMLDRDLKHVPVVRDGRAVGMIARHDLLKMMVLESEESEADEASTTEV